MHKLLAIFFLPFMSSVMAWEPANIPVAPQNLTFEGIQKRFQDYKNSLNNNTPVEIQNTKIQIIHGLNNLLLTRDLNEEKKEEAANIAWALNAHHLAINISQYNEIGNFGTMMTLGKDIVGQIIEHLSGNNEEGIGDIKDLLNLSMVNKSFHVTMLSLPSHIDFLPYGDKITNNFLTKVIEIFPSLTGLNLNSCYQVTDIGLANLQYLFHLTFLDLGSCYKMTDAGLVYLQHLSHLTYLDLGNCYKVTDAGIVNLRYLTKLTSLDLGGCHKITDRGLANLQNLTQLNYLGLENCSKVTNAGLAYFQNLTKLNYLDLMACKQITDAGLIHLQKIPQLTSLILYACHGITVAGMINIKRAIPRLNIE